MDMSEVLIEEFNQEIDITRHVLKRIPVDKLEWRPHQKSMSIGQLGLHTAMVPGQLSELFSELEREVPSVSLLQPSSLEEILLALERSERTALDHLQEWREEDLKEKWTMTNEQQTVIAAPRLSMVRSLMFNHWYHHRGQLTVYLRLLDEPVPAVYGASADES